MLVVAFNTWLAFRSVQSLLDSESWVQHTLRVINQVEQIMGSAKDAETGTRGFLITGDDNYLEPYSVAIKELPGEMNQFQDTDRGQRIAAGSNRGHARCAGTEVGVAGRGRFAARQW